jgi:hypothetical protein
MPLEPTEDMVQQEMEQFTKVKSRKYLLIFQFRGNKSVKQLAEIPETKDPEAIFVLDLFSSDTIL